MLFNRTYVTEYVSNRTYCEAECVIEPNVILLPVPLETRNANFNQ